jgi:hypothetical protein
MISKILIAKRTIKVLRDVTTIKFGTWVPTFRSSVLPSSGKK